MIVVDTCVITHLYNDTEFTSLAQEVLRINPHWCLPSSWSIEYANVLAKLFRGSNRQPDEVLNLFLTTRDQLKDSEYQIDTLDALKLGMRYLIPVYDAYFVVLAEQLHTQLITEDVEVLKKCKHCAVSMQDFIRLA